MKENDLSEIIKSIENIIWLSLKRICKLFTLIRLELKLAQQSIAKMVIIAFMIAIILIASFIWVDMLLILVLLNMWHNLSISILFTLFINILTIIGLLKLIANLKKDASFAATRRQMSMLKRESHAE